MRFGKKNWTLNMFSLAILLCVFNGVACLPLQDAKVTDCIMHIHLATLNADGNTLPAGCKPQPDAPLTAAKRHHALLRELQDLADNEKKKENHEYEGREVGEERNGEKEEKEGDKTVYIKSEVMEKEKETQGTGLEKEKEGKTTEKEMEGMEEPGMKKMKRGGEEMSEEEEDEMMEDDRKKRHEYEREEGLRKLLEEEEERRKHEQKSGEEEEEEKRGEEKKRNEAFEEWEEGLQRKRGSKRRPTEREREEELEELEREMKHVEGRESEKRKKDEISEEEGEIGDMEKKRGDKEKRRENGLEERDPLQKRVMEKASHEASGQFRKKGYRWHGTEEEKRNLEEEEEQEREEGQREKLIKIKEKLKEMSGEVDSLLHD